MQGGWIAAVALGWLLGAAAQLQQAALFAPAAYAGMALAAVGLGGVAWIARRGRPSAAGLALVLASMLLSCAQTGWRAGERLADRLAPSLEGQDLQLRGRVVGLPQVDVQGLRFPFVPDSAVGANAQPVKLPARLSLVWPSAATGDVAMAAAPVHLTSGERWELPVRLRLPHAAMNPEGFDAELWLFEQGIGAVGSVRLGGLGEPRRLEAPRAWRLDEQLGAWRQRWRDAVLLQGADPGTAGLLAALTVGDQGAIDGDGWALYRQTGVAHLMSISGLHITLFAWLAAAGIGWLWRRNERLMILWPAPMAARWGGVALAAAYALLAGWGVPAQRTVLMLALAVALRQAGLRWPPLLVCLVSGALVAAADPWALLQPGFWLSFVAVGLLIASDSPVAAPAEPVAEGWRTRARRVIGGAMRQQVVATVALAPLTLLLFQQVSLVGFVANLVAVPWITLLTTPLALAGLWWSPLWQLAGWTVQPLHQFLALLAQVPWATWAVPAAPTWAAALGLVGGACLVLPLPWPVRLLGLPLLLPLLAPAVQRPAPGEFELLAADVGQGSAVLVRTASHLLLHDTGPRYAPDSDAGQRVLLPLLRSRGERRIDTLVLSHRDADHVGGAAALLAQLPVGELRSSLEPGHPLLAGRLNLPCVAGQRWAWDGVQFEFLHPPTATPAPGTRPNAQSCVLRVRAADGLSALLTGDIEAPQEQALVERLGAALRSDILLVPHHGSRTSSTPAFLAAVAPRVAVIQVGYRSRFGHPHPAVLSRYAASGVAVQRTDQCGAWVWRDGGAWCTRTVRRRYWHAPGAEASPAGGAVVASENVAGEPE
ncbi:MAG: DNA internalization-related competence protein ComEC/Rec2 [Vitreoscilla sp.]|nr:DNA internalization-related competence protein ComEC/Rec2 [Vitreoscilla sp.]